MRWIEDYRSKLVKAEEAVALIKSGDKISISGNAAAPYVLLNALAQRKDDLKGVGVFTLLMLGENPLSKPDMRGRFRLKSLFVGPRRTSSSRAAGARWRRCGRHRPNATCGSRMSSIRMPAADAPRMTALE